MSEEELVKRIEVLEKQVRDLRGLVGMKKVSKDRREQITKHKKIAADLFAKISVTPAECKSIINGDVNYTLIFTKKGCGNCARFAIELARLLPQLDLASIRFIDALNPAFREIRNHFRIVNLPTTIKVVKGTIRETAYANKGLNILPRKK